MTEIKTLTGHTKKRDNVLKSYFPSLCITPSSDRGFTLIEVVTAVLILGLSLTTIVGLQSSILSQTLRDRNKTYALLSARSIMTELELDVAQLEPGVKKDKLIEFLQSSGSYKKTDQLFLEAVRDFDAEIDIQEFELPVVVPTATSGSGSTPASPPTPIKFFKIFITIGWGTTAIDTLKLPLLLPQQ